MFAKAFTEVKKKVEAYRKLRILEYFIKSPKFYSEDSSSLQEKKGLEARLSFLV